MAKNPQYWTSFAQVVGSSYEDAMSDMIELEAQKEMTAALIGETYELPENQNAMRTKAALYVVGNGLMNAAVEIGGGLQTLPDQLRRGQGAWKSWVDAMVDEGKEEVAQGVIERAPQNPMYGAGNSLFSTTDERAIFNPATAAREFAGGAVVGGVLGGGQIAAARGINAAARRAAVAQVRRQAESTPALPSGSGQEAETAAQIPPPPRPRPRARKTPPRRGRRRRGLSRLGASPRSSGPIRGRFRFRRKEAQLLSQ